MIDELTKAKLASDPEFRKQMIEALNESKKFEPVKPVSEYCKALETWGEIKSEKSEEFAKFWFRYIRIDLYKSCLLDRLIYCDEKLRTEMCPVHKGVWSGCVWDEPECAKMGKDCRHGSCVTGWVQNEGA